MKKKIYFILAAILQIILSIYCICEADSIVYNQKMEIPELGEQLAMTTNEVIAMSVINIVLSLVVGIIALKGNVAIRKRTLIVIYIILLLTTPSEIMTVISIINVIVLLCIKRKKKEKIKAKFNMKDAENRFKLEQYRFTKKQIVLLIMMLMIYLLQLIPASALPESKLALLMFIITIHASVLVLAIIVFWKDIKEGIILIKQNVRLYIKYLLRVFGIMYVFYYLANVITFFTTNKLTSVNQETIENLPLLLVAPLAIIWAPIVEETIFRGGIRKIIKNDIVYILISSVIFGALHALKEATIAIAISAAIPYIVIGVALSYIYAKTNNLAASIIAHSLWNTIGVVLMLIV